MTNECTNDNIILYYTQAGEEKDMAFGIGYQKVWLTQDEVYTAT